MAGNGIQERLLAIARKIRKELETPAVASAEFPKGFCQGASRILAKYLVQVEGITPVEGVANGERYVSLDTDGPICQCHFWLEHAGHVIDITADQFEDNSEAVIVTTDRTWHDQFRGQTRVPQNEVLDLNDYLEKKYQLLLLQLHRTDEEK